MKILIVFIFCIINSATAHNIINDEFESEWNTWKYEHNKYYDSLEEDGARKNVFIDNMLYIESFNKEGHSYKLGLNKFADLVSYKFNSIYTIYFTFFPI